MAGVPILSDIFGSKPDVAPFQNVDLGQEQLSSVLDNLKAFQSGDISKLGSMYQNYMTGLFNNLIPNFSSMLKAGGAATGTEISDAQSELEGNLPAGVAAAVQRASAQQNLGSGLLGSPMGGANAARNLGLTSLDMINRGAGLLGEAGNAAQRWAGIAQGTMLPANNFLVTPQEQFQATTQNRLIQRQVQQEKMNVAAAPNPIMKGLSDLVAYFTASYLGHGRAAGSAPAAENFSGATGAGASPTGGLSTGDWGAASDPTVSSMPISDPTQIDASIGTMYSPNENPMPNESMIASPVGYGYPGMAAYDPYANLYGTSDFFATNNQY